MKESKQLASQLYQAKKTFMIGTSLDVVTIREIEGKTIANDKPEPAAAVH